MTEEQRNECNLFLEKVTSTINEKRPELAAVIEVIQDNIEERSLQSFTCGLLVAMIGHLFGIKAPDFLVEAASQRHKETANGV